HRRLFGFVEPARTVLIASVETEAVSPADGAKVATPAPVSLGLAGQERVRLFARGEWREAPVVAVADLAEIAGPALIVRPDTQIAVLPGWRAAAEADGLVRLKRESAAARAEVALDRPDPVTLELFNRRFMGVAEAMGAALERTAHSVNIKERLDFSCALFDADGGLVANAPH